MQIWASTSLIEVYLFVDGSAAKMSNELQVTLPLSTRYIRLPPEDVRLDDDDMYKEYVEVQQGSGFVPGEEGVCLPDMIIIMKRTQTKEKYGQAIFLMIKVFHLTYGLMTDVWSKVVIK